MVLDRLDDEIPGHGVKELRDIEVDNPVVLEAPFPARRDRIQRPPSGDGRHRSRRGTKGPRPAPTPSRPQLERLCQRRCLLYTSDAADEEDSVDLGGRRI